MVKPQQTENEWLGKGRAWHGARGMMGLGADHRWAQVGIGRHKWAKEGMGHGARGMGGLGADRQSGDQTTGEAGAVRGGLAL